MAALSALQKKTPLCITLQWTVDSLLHLLDYILCVQTDKLAHFRGPLDLDVFFVLFLLTDHYRRSDSGESQRSEVLGMRVDVDVRVEVSGLRRSVDACQHGYEGEGRSCSSTTLA